METVGIIGGFGPETTAKFMMRLVSMWTEHNSSTRPEILLWNAPINVEHEKEFISSSKFLDEFKNLVIKGAKTLEKSGADFLVLPCNSLHIFIADIQDAVKIPVLNIVDETQQTLIKANIIKIGLLATSATRNSNIFADKLNKSGIEIFHPNDIEQKKLDITIENLVSINSPISNRQIVTKIASELIKKGASIVLLACTDLQLMKPFRFKFIDTLEVLACSTVEKMREK